MATADFSRDVSPPPGAGPAQARVPQGEASESLQRNLKTLAARRNSRQLQNALMRAAVWAFGISAVLLLLHRFYLADVSPVTFAVIFIAALLIGVRNGTLHRAGIFDAAVDADRVLGLDDRLSSAVAFVSPDAVKSVRRAQTGRSPLQRLHGLLLPRLISRTTAATSPTELVPALVEDAAARSAELQPKSIYPFSFDRSAKLLAATALVFTVLLFMPDIEWLRTPEQKAAANTMRRQGKELAAVAKQIREKKDSEASPEVKKLAQRLQALGIKMQRGRMSKREALVSMGQLKKDMEKNPVGGPDERNSGGKQDLDAIAQALAGESMESSAGKRAQEELKKKDANKAADELEKLADQMAKGELSNAEKEKAANDMEKVARALRKAGGEKNEETARQLEEAAKELREQARSGGESQQKQGGQQQSQGGQQNGQNQNGKQGQQQQGGQGQQKQGQQQQSGQQGGQGQQQQQNGSQQGQQGGQSQQGQQGQQGQQNGQGQQGGQSQSGQQGSQGQSPGGSSQNGANALRDLANGLRQGSGSGNNSQNLKDMLDKIREAENDTGQNNGGQSGGQNGKNGKYGQNGEGQGDGKNMTPGKDLIATDPHGQVAGGTGLGPRNNATGRQQGGGVSQSKANRSGDKRRWEDVWSDRLPKTQDKLSRINGKMGNQGQMEQLPTRTEAKGGPVTTPYYEVYESYKKDAEDAVSKDVVPPAYKQPVKDYFDSLKPQGN